MSRFHSPSFPSVLVVFVSVMMLVFPPALHARSGRKPAGPVSSPVPSSTTAVTVVSDGPEIFLEMKRRDGAGAPGAGADGDNWEAACAPPCDRPLPRTALLRVNGEDVNPSAGFALPSDRDQVTIDVKVGSARWSWTGIILSAFGGSFVLGGAGPPLLMGGSFSTTEKVLTGAGVTLLAVGLPLWFLSRTIVSVR
jgi:hypothetical protein